MEVGFVNDVLIELGWGKEISIPVANEENKRICALIRETKKNVIANKNEILSIKDKLTVIVEHKKNARLERSNCESIVNALNNDIDTENHMRKITERELGRLKHDIEKYKKRLIEVEKKKHMYENTNFSKSMELERIKEKMQWDQQDLEKYLAECNNQEDLANYLNQYTRQDNSKAAVLNHQISELVLIKNKTRKHLDDALIETKIIQVELDKTADQYRKEHVARKEVIKMWQTTIEQMIRRDNDILRVSNELNAYKDKLRRTEAELQEKKSLCQDMVNDNSLMESNVNRADRDIAKLRETYTISLEELEKYKRELEFLKSTISRTARECEIGRSTVRHLKEQKAIEETRLEILKAKVEELNEKFKAIQSESFDINSSFVFAEDNLKQEEMYISQLAEEMSKLREKQYKISMDLIATQSMKRNREADSITYLANLRNLISRKGKCEMELLKLDELIYKTDLTIQHLEHRIAVMEGDNTPTEIENELKLRIKNLTEEFDSINAVIKQLTEMIKRFVNESRIHQLNIDKLSGLKKDEEENLISEQISIESALLHLGKVKRKKEETLLYKNMENFQMKKLKAISELHFNKVTDLEVQKQSLQSIINDRRVEINFYKSLLKKDLLTSEQELANIHKQLSEVNHRLDKIKAKYDVVSKVSYFENKEGTLATVEAALEKEEYQKYGDKLDMKIRQHEKEIRALENTVVLVNSCNESFRYLYTKANAGSSEMIMKEQAEKDLKAEMKLFSMKRFQLRMILKEIEKTKTTLESQKGEYELTQNTLRDMNDRITKKENDIENMKEKIDQADMDIEVMLSLISTETTSITDIKLRVSSFMIELFTTELLNTLTKKFPEIWEKSGQAYFENFNIEINLSLKKNQKDKNSSNTNNLRMSSHTVQMSVVNLAVSFDSQITSQNISNRSSHNSSTPSSQSSVKLRLKNQGLKPFLPDA